MEYIIILFLLVFLIIIILLKQINHIKKFNKNNNNLKSIFNHNLYDKYIFFQKNPIIFYLYENIYKSLQKINKYDHKSYIIFTKIKTASSDKLSLDWMSYTGGMIKMSIDSIIKIIKKKENINSDFINNIAKLKLYYQLFYKNIDMNTINKNISKYIHNKKIKSNRVIYNLFYINEILDNLSSKYFNSLDNSKLALQIKKIIKKINNDNNFYLYNSFLNNRLDKNYIEEKNSLFSEYFYNI